MNQETAANGHFDFRFALFSTEIGGVPVGAVQIDGTPVTDGLFTVQLDFGADAFDSTFGTGVIGWATSDSSSVGVCGQSEGTFGSGVRGIANGNSGINYGVRGFSNSSSGYDFYAAGAGQDWGSSSSIRWKSNVQNIDQPLEKVARLRGVYFDWDKDHGGHHDVGMIAEEVGAVLPEIVTYEENGVDANGMDYSKLTPLLVEAIRELTTRYQETTTANQLELSELKKENESLRERLATLESRMQEMTNYMLEKHK